MRWLLVLWLCLAACDDTVIGGGGQTYTPDWLGTQVFFVDHCVQCHPSVEPSLDLPGDILVDVCDETGIWVVPGDPEASMLWRLVADTGLENDPAVMPFGTGPLPSGQTDFLREWIAAGARVEGCP
ncbi:MAG: hypothetical protein ACJAZO_005398 [Myxococcota bacterium]|jgi:hypothetical protein